MTSRAALFAVLFVAAAPAAQAQQSAGRGHTIADFRGLWSAQPGGQAGVEIRIYGRRIVARELIRGGQNVQCGTEGRGNWVGRTSYLEFHGRCSNGRTMNYVRCAVTAEAPGRLLSRCENGHSQTLHRVGG